MNPTGQDYSLLVRETLEQLQDQYFQGWSSSLQIISGKLRIYIQALQIIESIDSIHNLCIYVKKKLHGKVVNYVFMPVTATNSLHDEREYQPSDAPELIPIVSPNDPNDPNSLPISTAKSASFGHKETGSDLHSVSLLHDIKATGSTGSDSTSKMDSFPAATQHTTATNSCNIQLLDLPSSSFS